MRAGLGSNPLEGTDWMSAYCTYRRGEKLNPWTKNRTITPWKRLPVHTDIKCWDGPAFSEGQRVSGAATGQKWGSSKIHTAQHPGSGKELREESAGPWQGDKRNIFGMTAITNSWSTALNYIYARTVWIAFYKTVKCSFFTFFSTHELLESVNRWSGRIIQSHIKRTTGVCRIKVHDETVVFI